MARCNIRSSRYLPQSYICRGLLSACLVSLLVYAYFFTEGRNQMRVAASSPRLHKPRQQGPSMNQTENPECKHSQQVILLTYGRSGSSFTANIITLQEEIFYYFEPLHSTAKSFEVLQREYFKAQKEYLHLTKIKEYNRQALSVIEKLITCDFADLPKLAAVNRHYWYFDSTKDLYNCMQRAKDTEVEKACLKAVEKKCKQKSIQFAKTIRLKVDSAGKLMTRLPCLKMIYLVRDPRGSYQSRRQAWGTFLRFEQPFDAKRFCLRLRNDVSDVVKLHQKYPNRVHITRYENIAENPLETSKRLYEFLNWNFTTWIAEYVYNNTMAGLGEQSGDKTYTLSRNNSTETSYAWRNTISYADVLAFDTHCGPVYSKLGYLPIKSEEDLRNLDLSLKTEGEIYT